MINFIKTKNIHLPAQRLAEEISAKLNEGKSVLWLVSGGSAAEVAVDARRQLAKTNNLTVMQVDERFGPPGHENSNWQKLLEAGFETENINCLPVLKGATFNQTTEDYEHTLKKELETAQFRVGLFGVGADGHTAGILPGSPVAHSQKLVCGYNGPDFQRITITPKTIEKLDASFVYLAGENKAHTLKKLQSHASMSEQPAQSLKTIKNTLVYYDIKEINL